MTKGVEQVT